MCGSHTPLINKRNYSSSDKLSNFSRGDTLDQRKKIREFEPSIFSKFKSKSPIANLTGRGDSFMLHTPKNRFKRSLTKLEIEEEKIRRKMEIAMLQVLMQRQEKLEKIKQFKNSVSSLINSKYEKVMLKAPGYNKRLMRVYSQKTHPHSRIKRREKKSRVRRKSAKIKTSKYVTGDPNIVINRPLDSTEVDYPKIISTSLPQGKDVKQVFPSSISLLNLRNRASRSFSCS